MLEQPLAKMGLQDQVMHKYNEALRKNVRRVHEMEYVINKYQKSTVAQEILEGKFKDLEEKIKTQQLQYENTM